MIIICAAYLTYLPLRLPRQHTVEAAGRQLARARARARAQAQAQAVSRGSRGIGNVVAQRQRGRIKQTNVKMTRFVVYHIYRKQVSLPPAFLSLLPSWTAPSWLHAISIQM